MKIWNTCRGFTLLELLVVVLVIGILSGLSVPIYQNIIERARNVRAISEIKNLEKEILKYEDENEKLPDNLAQASPGANLDPWGNPYQYVNLGISGPPRLDAFMVPLNTTFDLYSMGRDGLSTAPITAASSWDDLLRGNDGAFVGLASTY